MQKEPSAHCQSGCTLALFERWIETQPDKIRQRLEQSYRQYC